ncbi:MAG: YciI family protein [Gemmatimonadota bacterium]
MNDFLLIYQGGDPNWMERSPEEIEAVMRLWHQWFEELEASGNLRNPGAALAPSGVTLRKNGDAVVTDMPMAEVKELIGGYSVIQAEFAGGSGRARERLAVSREQPGWAHPGAAGAVARRLNARVASRRRPSSGARNLRRVTRSGSRHRTAAR